MKLPNHGVYRQAANSRSAFTLIEMIGVLAVIAILASMLIPRVFEAINSARVNSTAVACETVKTAAADHFGKYGQFDLTNGTGIYLQGVPVITNYDVAVLMQEGLLDKPFSARIAGADNNGNSYVELVRVDSSNPGGPPGAASGGYSLDGSGANSIANASFVLEAVIKHVSQADAKDLNDRIDGTALGTLNGALGVADKSGRVEYAAPKDPGSTVDVYVYLTHR